MKQLMLLTAIVFLCQVSCKNETNLYTSEVNPFFGTSRLLAEEEVGYTPPEGWRVWAGLVFPGASLPNAMVQLTPVTEFGSGAGYNYEDNRILGFVHTMKGHWNLGNISFFPETALPAAGEIGSVFSHDNETASPGYYSVLLSDDSIDVELSSTLRCGYHRYTFQPDDSEFLIIDLSRANNRVDGFGISFENEFQLKGFQQTEETTVYFYAAFDKAIHNLYCYNDGKWIQLIDFERLQDEESIIAIQFDKESGRTLSMKTGISFVDTDHAKQNLENEIPEWNFTKTRKAAKAKWEDVLSKIKVEGGSDKERMIFYTSLYRTFLWPALRSDTDGSYRDLEGEIRKTQSNYYSLPSLWDTFRNKLVLLSLLDKELTGDIIQSLVDMGKSSGYMPIFFHGDHAASFISGAYQRGVNNFDIEKAYQLLLKNATDSAGPRPYLDEYISKGYISTKVVRNPIVETSGKAGVAKTLEYAYDDYSLARFAEALGDSLTADIFFSRSLNYKNVFDTQTCFMRGRLADGNWVSPFIPEYPYYEYMFREANAWQQTFFVPHDVEGLIELFGGAKNFENKLDSMFAIPWNPEYIARNVCCFLGQYCHGNQPDHHVPYLYYFVNKPNKSQEIINQIQNLYGIGEYGLALPGMDDTGEMSCWYVFTSLGIYPFSPTDPEYILSVPTFKKTHMSLGEGKTLEINRINASNGSSLVIQFNGKAVQNYTLDHQDMKNGGIIDIYTSAGQ